MVNNMKITSKTTLCFSALLVGLFIDGRWCQLAKSPVNPSFSALLVGLFIDGYRYASSVVKGDFSFSALLVGLFIDGDPDRINMDDTGPFQCPFGWAVH